MTGNLYIIWSPSGGGKTSLVAALMERDAGVRRSVSHTTRGPREGEAHGREYHFVDHAAFRRMIDNADFFEYAEVYDHFYGTSSHGLTELLAAGLDVFLTIDWQGGREMRRLFPDLTSIFVLPPSLAALGERLLRRALDSDEVITRRLACARQDLTHFQEFDYVIINEDFASAVDDLAAIVRATRLKRDAQLQRYPGLLENLIKIRAAD